MSDGVMIGVDWGSSSLRAFCIAADGSILDTRRADDGVFTGTGDYAERLRRLLGDWLQRWPGLPILLCGMIGSDRGWMPAPYAAAPAGPGELAAALISAPFDRPARIVPGVSHIAGETCEVMRGEETLLMGLEVQAPRLTVCLPGTHTKWVDLADGRITAFRTYMTGEMRAALLSGGTLAPQVPQVASPSAFMAGLAAGRSASGLARALFQARARRLLGTLAPEHTAAFVSGVLIGDEIASEAARDHVSVILAARDALADDYGAALARAGMAFRIVNPEPLAARGLLRLAGRAGLL